MSDEALDERGRKGPRTRRWRASTTKTTRTSPASAWSRSAPSFTPCSPPRGRCAGCPTRRDGASASPPRPSQRRAPSPRPPRPWSEFRDGDDILTVAAALAPRVQVARRRPRSRRRASPPRRGRSAQAAVESRPTAARRMDHALAHDAGRAEEIGRRQDFAGRARTERAPARRRARRFRRQGRDHQRAPRPGRHALRTRAGAGHQIVAGDRARRRHRPLDVGDLGPRRRRAGPQRHRHRTAEPAPRDGLSARAARQPGFRQVEAPPADRARQDDRRRAGDRRSRPHAASAGRRHHRLGQVGRDQHHDPVAALPAEARAVPADHGRSEDAGTLGL